MATGTSVGLVPPPLQFADPIFSRVPFSEGVYTLALLYVVLGVTLFHLLLIVFGINLDAAEKKKRRERLLVPENSVPCALAEQHHLDETFIRMQTLRPQERVQRMNFISYACRFVRYYPSVVAREHLAVSLLLRPLPVFSRAKRAFLISTHLQVCILIASMAFNWFEHELAGTGRYELLWCPGGGLWTDVDVDGGCRATLPLAAGATVLLYPIFRILCVRPMRQTCFQHQGHINNSQFNLNIKKFAAVPSRTWKEEFMCMTTFHERRIAAVYAQRRFIHRLVCFMWFTLTPQLHCTRFFSIFISCCVAAFLGLVNCFSITYTLVFTAFLPPAALYHWAAAAAVMFFGSAIVVEPASLFIVSVIWKAFVMSRAQQFGCGPNAISSRYKYQDCVRQVHHLFFDLVRTVAARRIQSWWRAVIDMHRALNEQTMSAIKIQSLHKRLIQQKRYFKSRKWCLKLDVLKGVGLEEVQLEGVMNPFVRVQCDSGNPRVVDTNVAWSAGSQAEWNHSFFVDIKESNRLYLTVWSKDLSSDEFIGRGYFDFDDLKAETSKSFDWKLPLYDMHFSDPKPRDPKALKGHLEIRFSFLDPLTEVVTDADWMLPKHRMQFVMSRLGKQNAVGKVLTAFGHNAGEPPAASGFAAAFAAVKAGKMGGGTPVTVATAPVVAVGPEDGQSARKQSLAEDDGLSAKLPSSPSLPKDKTAPLPGEILEGEDAE